MAVAMTDAIPLMQSDGTTGRNNARDIRTQLLGALLLPDSVGYGVRPGVIPRRWIGVGAADFPDLRAIQLDTPGQAVQLYPGKCIVVRTGQGPYLLSQETTISPYALDAADPSNPRIDIVYARLYDHGIGDSGGGPHGPYIEHVNGTPSGSPVAPTGSVPAGALPIAQILRAANDNTIVAADITDLRKSTQLLGTPRILLPGDALADAGIFPSERRIRMASASEITSGSQPFIEEIWCGDSRWHPTITRIVGRNRRTSSINTTATSAGTALRIFTVQAQVLAGHTYEISMRGELLNTAAPSTAQIDMRYTTNGVEPTVSDTQLYREIVRLDGISIPESINGSFTYQATSDVQLRVTAAMFSAIGGGTLTFGASASSPGEMTIEDKGFTVAIAGTIY